MEPSTARGDTAQQLEKLRVRLHQDNPQLYRHWALYLQVLRDELEGVVNKACFQLAVSELPLRYSAMPSEARQQLHVRLARLVRRTCALLTVEQLHALAEQTERRLRRVALRQQRQLLAAMEASQLVQAPEVDAVHEPPGSVHLGLALPLSRHSFALGQASSQIQAGELEPEESQPASDLDQDTDALMQVFAKLLENQVGSESAAQTDSERLGLLPDNPLELLTWFDGLDGALARRLRNLSHAINVALVRQGLNSTLLPLRTLEAIASGQLETQDAAPHLVRLAMPGMRVPVAQVPDVLCVLLRPVDLEVNAPRLRTCRTRLQQARLEVRRMAQTYHRLERRLQALDAEALWLHDHSTAQLSNNPPTA